MIFSGGAQLFYALRTHSGGRAILEAILGLIYIGAGIYVLLHTVGGLLAITLLLASFLVVYGVIALVLAFRMRPYRGWGWVLVDGIITILLGILIWAHWPSSSIWAIGTLIGISLIFSGISRLMLSSAASKPAAATA